MNRLVSEIVSTVRGAIRASVANLQSPSTELRSVFHGPPMDLLRPAFDQLVAEGGIEATLKSGEAIRFPILLQVDELPPGQGNPEIGESGPCDESHLLTLRNSPSCPRFVALVPPGRHRILSVSSATNEFGLSPDSNSGNATIEQWWGDDYVQGLVDAAIGRNSWRSEAERDEAKRLIERAIRAADEVDRHDVSRRHAWAVLSRVFSISDAERPYGQQLSLACGFPPLADGSVRAQEQIDVLDELADELVDVSFRLGIERLKKDADPSDVAALDECLDHLQHACDIPTAFARATPFYYAPSQADVVVSAPSWWSWLTVERWNELLEEERQPKGTPQIVCKNSIIPPCRRGVNALVIGAVELEVSLPDEVPGPVKARVTRDAGGAAKRLSWDLTLDPDSQLMDAALPLHRSPARYKLEAAGLRNAGIKVISLQTWAPGVFAFCRTATKTSAPKKAKANREQVSYECALTLSGEGRHYFDLYVSPNVTVGAVAVGHDAGGLQEKPMQAVVSLVSDHAYGFEVEATADCYYDIDIKKDDEEGKLRLQISCDESTAEGCKSEFERLIRLNRQSDQGRGTADVQIDRQMRCADLQTWILEKDRVDRSFFPVVLAPDYASAWRPPEWKVAEDSLLSKGRFLHDPRPGIDEMQAAPTFVHARVALAERIRRDDGSGLIESAQLGVWLSGEPSFAQLVEDYVRCYVNWLDASPDIAAWVDVVAVTGLEPGGKTLGQEPDAVLLSPLHPLRLGWHALAQKTLYLAYQRNAPCPAGSVLDPKCIPDALVLPLRTATGTIKRQVFFSVESTSDYWAVLWNASRLDRLAVRIDQAPLDKEFGIQIGGVSSGFSVSQVHRALDDVSSMLSAKTVLNILISSAPSQNNACNEGIVSWCREQFSRLNEKAPAVALGGRLMQVYDDRKEVSRPDDAEVSNLAEDTSNSVRWFGSLPEGVKPDLGIIAQLESSNAGMDLIEIGSPVGIGALIRQRIRRQLTAGAGAFLSESRMGSARRPSGDGLADKVMGGIVLLENLIDARYGYTFAPNVHAVESVLKDKRSDYAAVSSSAVDPACFLGNWLADAYLWDYDLPSYSHRAGDTNGYYLLSSVKDTDRETLKEVLARLPGCESLEDTQVEDVILEVARRGIPTVRGLSGGDTGASGDLGLLTASRLLQDEFRREPGTGGLLQAISTDGSVSTLGIVVPVDPFRGYLEDLRRALGKAEFLRPDLIVAGISITDSSVKCLLTPIEVKFRGQEVMGPAACKEALDQAKALSRLLTDIQDKAADPDLLLWKLAFQHLLISMVGFGFRVYSQHLLATKQPREWSAYHRRFVEAILSEEVALTISPVGRLILVDKSSSSGPRDQDGDGFKETIVLGARDAGEIIRSQPKELYGAIRGAVGNWDLLPLEDAPPTTGEAGTRIHDEFVTRATGSTAPDVVQVEGLEVSVADAGDVGANDIEASPGGIAPAVSHEPAEQTDEAVTPKGIVIEIGATTDTFRSETKLLNLSDTNLNQLNIGVVGDLGTGKTQLVKSLIYQVSRSATGNQGIKPRILIFDYKKDYSSEEFVRAVGARVVKPQQLPINIFDVSGAGEALTPWLDRFKFFSDVLDKIFTGIGPVQRQQLKQAVRQAYEECKTMNRQPTIYDVHAKYRAILGSRTDSPLSIIDDLVDMEMFSPNPGTTANFAKFLDGVVVIALNALGSDDRTKNMLVAFMLNMYYEHMLRIPKRPYVGTNPQLRVIDSFLLVDEADNIMRYEFDVLRKLLLQGREFGVGVVLASQYLRHFKSGATDYREPLLTWFIHKVPNITPHELGALGLTADATQIADRVKTLANHHCLFKTFNVGGDIVRGTPFFELLSRPKH